MAWKSPTLLTALIEELPVLERARPFSFYHPLLRGFYKVLLPFNESELQRVGIIDDLPTPDSRSLQVRVNEVYPEITSFDKRLLHEVKLFDGNKLSFRCGGCKLWRSVWTLIDVRNYPEVYEKPILQKEWPSGSGNMVLSRNPKDVTGYHPASDLKRGAGFVCDGCWTHWIRFGYRINGVTYTRLEHIKALGAPSEVLTSYALRAGVSTIGFGDT